MFFLVGVGGRLNLGFADWFDKRQRLVWSQADCGGPGWGSRARSGRVGGRGKAWGSLLLESVWGG